jgi:hypothetical protein
MYFHCFLEVVMSTASKLCNAAIVFLVGLLILDLAPITEKMVCDDYGNVTTCPDVFFSQSYFDARSRFTDAAQNAGALLQQHIVFSSHGVTYTTDVATLPGAEDRVLIHVSGTHGVEGYVGSAIQVKLLREWNKSRSNGPTVVFVHALNPYGFAHNRRFNEENVDLNRNFFDSPEEWDAARQRDPNIAGFDTFSPLLNMERTPRLFDRYAMLVKAAYYVVRYGFLTLKKALVAGQYHDRTGLNYGGVTEQRSFEVLREVLKPYVGRDHITAIDVHSGLGAAGVDSLLVDASQEPLARAVLRNGKIEVMGQAQLETLAGYEFSCGFLHFRWLQPKKSILDFTQEFGTVPGVFVARELILENAAYQLARGSYAHEVTQRWLRDAFYPQKNSFKEAVLKRGAEVFDQCFDHLRNAGS